MNYLGLITAIVTFFIIGIFHPIVVKAEYRYGTHCWWAFLVIGLLFIGISLLLNSQLISIVLGVIGCSCLWSIFELFQQRQRVLKGWFPKNPKRTKDYENN